MSLDALNESVRFITELTPWHQACGSCRTSRRRLRQNMTAEFAAVNNDAAYGLARGEAIRIESALDRVEISDTATRHAKKICRA